MIRNFRYKVMNVVLPLVRINTFARSVARMASSLSQKAPQYRMVWVDLEMTGLDIEKDKILEMACVITDCDLNILKEGPTCVIHQPDEVLDNMNDWCVDHHKKSGLTTAVQQSAMTLEEAQDKMLKFVHEYTPKGKCPMAGNSVHVDKQFLVRDMRPFIDHLHYRIVDVSTVKELCRRWYPDIFYDAPVKNGTHRASCDIHQSIEELKYYRSSAFK